MGNRIYILILITCSLTSCFKHDECDPSVICNTIKPDSYYVNINVSYVAGANPVYVTLFKGDVEDNQVVLLDTFYSESHTYYLPTTERYSAKAIYYDNGTYYNAYDGGKLKVSHFWNCNEKCFEGEELTLDLSLLQ